MQMDTVEIGISPCPNDTFIFDAMIHGKVDTEGITFNPFFADVEELNQRAFTQEFLVTKMSYFSYAFLTNTFVALNSGSALGEGCGPLLICHPDAYTKPVHSLKTAIPGKYTTAHLLLSLAFPGISRKQEMLFTEIEGAILSGEVDAGAIIHENRFTYKKKGLLKKADLGTWWETTSGLPIPLGGIFIQRETSLEIRQLVNRVLKKSIKYAFENPESSRPFTKQHASELEDSVIDQHIKLYVNQFSLDLGARGKQAISALFKKAVEKNLVPATHPNLFI
ncbi:MAG: 1,4-dihydroxy-6-naphthoate synthase [Nitrospinota bacterium]